MSNLNKRGSNFSKEEELLLLEQISLQKKVIENKTTNNISGAEKNEAWRKVLEEFNSSCLQHPRTLQQIKSKYDNLKTKTRKWAADHKFDLKGTGGGPTTNISSDPVIEAVLNIINHKTVCGLPSIGDDDYEERSVITSLPNNELDIMNINPSKYNLDLIEPIIEENIMLETIPEDFQTTEDDISILEEPLAKKIKHSVNKNIITVISDKTTNGATANWSSYTPKMIEEPMNKRLRPKIPNPTFIAKEEYYKKKTELLQITIDDINRKSKEETSKFELEYAIMENREKREQEEHKKKCALLDLKLGLALKEIDNN